VLQHLRAMLQACSSIHLQNPPTLACQHPWLELRPPPTHPPTLTPPTIATPLSVSFVPPPPLPVPVWCCSVLLFVSSAAWTVTNLRDELGDILAGDDGTLGDITLAGLGLGE